MNIAVPEMMITADRHRYVGILVPLYAGLTSNLRCRGVQVTWRQFVRAIEVSQRRAAREAQQRQRAQLRQATQHARETAKRQRQWDKEQKWLQASSEAAQFEHYIEALLSLHTECGDNWDWNAVASCPPPPEPQRDLSGQQAAEAAIAVYQPGFIERAFGAAKTHRTTLDLALANAVATETARYQAACVQFQEDRRNWEINVRLAPRVLRLEAAACTEALKRAHSFDDIERFGSAVRLTAIEQDVATMSIVICNDEIVPREEVKLTASGKLSTKAMSESRYWNTFQGHVCSCALRVALEAFAGASCQKSNR